MNRTKYLQDATLETKNMGLLDFLLKSKEERKKDKRIEDVLQRTDDFIERTERMLGEMEKDDKRWRSRL